MKIVKRFFLKYLQNPALVMLCCYPASPGYSQFIQIWAQVQNPSTSTDVGTCITNDATGIYVGGTDQTPGDWQWRIQKRNLTTGAVIWTQTNNPSAGNDQLYGITSDAGGVYVVGYVENGGDYLWRIEKRNLTTGALIWSQTTNPSAGGDRAFAVTADASGVYIAGEQSISGVNFQWRIEKRDINTGALIWAQINNPSAYDDEPWAITSDATGIYIAGHDSPSIQAQWRIEKRDKTTGNVIWAQTTDPSNNDDQIYGITKDASGIYIVGFDGSTGFGDEQWRIEKRSLTTGALIWSQTNNPSAGFDVARSVTADAGGVFLAGYEISPGNNQWRIEKRDLNTGVLLCSETSNPSSGSDAGRGITIDGTGVYIAGSQNISGVNNQWRIEKYDLCAPPLPIELLFFDAQLVQPGMYVRCDWSTASEINNDYFSVEKSNDGIFFNQIGTIKGAGTSATTQNYSFYDYEPFSPVSYYRLKQVDYDGQFTYSPVRAVDVSGQDGLNFIVTFGNQSVVSVSFFNASESEAVLEMFNAYGQKVFSENVTLQEGTTKTETQINQLTTGVYFFRVTLPGREIVKKIFFSN